jgi:hypothetical protein
MIRIKKIMICNKKYYVRKSEIRPTVRRVDNRQSTMDPT